MVNVCIPYYQYQKSNPDVKMRKNWQINIDIDPTSQIVIIYLNTRPIAFHAIKQLVNYRLTKQTHHAPMYYKLHTAMGPKIESK